MDVFTISAALDNTDTALATLPTESAQPYLYWMKAANGGTVAQRLRLEQQRHSRGFRDNSVIPAHDPSAGGDITARGDTVAFGGDPERDKLLTFNASGTLLAVANPDSTLQGGSIHVTLGLAIP